MAKFFITPKKQEQAEGEDVHSGVSCILSGDEVLINTNKQSITIGCMDIEGCLDVEGQLFVLNLENV